MTQVRKLKNGVTLIIAEAEEPQQCDLCGKIDELRPYGPNGEAICFECGMKDEATTGRMFNKRLDEGDR
jgi:hypothetical protein